MSLASGADEMVIGYLQFIPQGFELGCDDIAVFLLRHALICCNTLDILSVLISSSKEEHVIATQTVITSHYICSYGTISVPDVRHIVNVIYRCGNIEFTHSQFPLSPVFGLRGNMVSVDLQALSMLTYRCHLLF